MRKAVVYIFIIMALLVGCGEKPEAPAATTTPATEQTAAAVTIPTETEPVAEVTLPAETMPPVETEAPVTEETPVVETSAELPYLETLERGGVSIFDGPSYNYGCVDIVRNKGIYTIVEEAVDDEGNLWGKLKSGVGWINLTELRSEDYKTALISANYADKDPVLNSAHHSFSTGREYAIPIAIHAYGTLQDVTIYDMLYNAEGPYPGEELFTLPELTEAMPLVAELDFPGDMSMYGIRFLDEAGQTHTYLIYMSARNGSLVLEKNDSV